MNTNLIEVLDESQASNGSQMDVVLEKLRNFEN